jgi:hypothetical protein
MLYSGPHLLNSAGRSGIRCSPSLLISHHRVRRPTKKGLHTGALSICGESRRMNRAAVFVDAGYFFAQGSKAIWRTHHSRNLLDLNESAVVAELMAVIAAKAPQLPAGARTAPGRDLTTNEKRHECCCASKALTLAVGRNARSSARCEPSCQKIILQVPSNDRHGQKRDLANLFRTPATIRLTLTKSSLVSCQLTTSRGSHN